MKRLIIQLWQARCEEPQLAATPFFFASAAAAMDTPVEIHVLGASIEMFVKSNNQRHAAIAPLGRKLSDFIEDAVRSGVKLYACSTAMRDRNLQMADLIDGFVDVIGMVTMLDRMAEVDTRVLTY